MEVTVPVAPQVEKGAITVRIAVVSQFSKQEIDVEIEILVLFHFMIFQLKYSKLFPLCLVIIHSPKELQSAGQHLLCLT